MAVATIDKLSRGWTLLSVLIVFLEKHFRRIIALNFIFAQKLSE